MNAWAASGPEHAGGSGREMPEALRRDLEFILAPDGLARDAERPPALRRSVRAAVPGKLALAAMLGAAALALLGRPYGVANDEPRPDPARAAPAVPALVRLGGPAGRAVPSERADARRTGPAPGVPALVPEPLPTGRVAVPVRSVPAPAPGTEAPPAVASDAERPADPAGISPSVAPQAAIPAPPRVVSVIPVAPKLVMVSSPAPAAGSATGVPARPQTGRTAATPPGPAKPSPAKRRDAVDAMLGLRRQ